MEGKKNSSRLNFPRWKADVIGWFDGDDLVSQVAVYPMKAKIFRKDIQDGRTDGESVHIPNIPIWG